MIQKKQGRSYIMAVLGILLAIAADQYTKYLAVIYLKEQRGSFRDTGRSDMVFCSYRHHYICADHFSLYLDSKDKEVFAAPYMRYIYFCRCGWESDRPEPAWIRGRFFLL